MSYKVELSQLDREVKVSLTQQLVDREVARLLRAAEERAVALLTQHRTALDRLAAILVEEETVDGEVVLDVLRAEADGARPQRLGTT